jgi:pyridoxal 5'-phosphate synthase pdxT subunit
MDSTRRARIGVLAVQGAVREHVAAIRDIGAEPVEVRLPRDLVDLDALILPGGESTTMRRLIDAYGLREPIAALARAGAPLLGTCAGMILLADRLTDGDAPYFGLLDLEVRRNGYGRQLDSFETELAVAGLDAPFHGVFIRAPRVESAGPEVEVLAEHRGDPVLVREGRVMAAVFHPELTADHRLHARFVELVDDRGHDHRAQEA